MTIIKAKARGIESVSGVAGSSPFLQTKYAQKVDTATITFAANTYTVLHTDLQVNITPTATNNVIKLEGAIFGEFDEAGNLFNHTCFFYRDTTVLGGFYGGSAEGIRPQGVTMMTRTYQPDNQDSTPECSGTFTFFDVPGTTSQVTYKLGMYLRAAGNLHLNTTVSNDNQNYTERCISYISATEIAV